VAGNGRAGFLFDFTVIWAERTDVPIEDNPIFKSYGFIHDSIYDVSVLEGEASGFDYDNPAIDPFDGTAAG
jgi:hypothetical protein